MINKINQGDCLEVLKNIPDNSVDSIITDPPYELGFMGKSWDNTGIANNKEMWAECLRVLKPGGHLLSFSGTRTYHRMAVAIEDVGFEVRDMIEWIYGSGFPKSLNIGKAINKIDGVEFDKKPASGVGFMNNDKEDGYHPTINQLVQKGESSERAKQWEGWGTALKPAHEPICMARKPLAEKTVAENCLKWGTGGINIDDSRVGTEERTYGGMSAKQPDVGTFRDDNWKPKDIEITVNGRFPANLIHDNSEEVRECFPETKSVQSKRGGATNGNGKNIDYGNFNEVEKYECGFNDSGSASRFFKSIIYTAKASKSERNKGCSEEEIIDCDRNPECYSADVPFNRSANPKRNNHPTVKPIALIEYLIKMATPKGGIVLDPFIGSGTTALACKNLGFNFIGIEKEEEYCKIANARINYLTHFNLSDKSLTSPIK